MKSLGHLGRSCHQTYLYPLSPSHPHLYAQKLIQNKAIGVTPRNLPLQLSPVQQRTTHPGAAANGLTSTASGGSPMLQVLGNTRPVDRLRYQAKFVFNAMDSEQKGGF